MSEQPLRGKKDLITRATTGEEINPDLGEPDRRDRAEDAVALAVAGAGYTEIARICQYPNEWSARAAVEKALGASAPKGEKRELERAKHRRRLDALLKAVWTKAINPRDADHLNYHRAAIAVLDRQARLYGLDAPTQVTITPSQEKIEETLARFESLARTEHEQAEAEITEAGDIIDAEIEE